MRILDFLKKGTMVEVCGTPFAKGYLQEDQSIRTEIRLNVSRTNILRPASENMRKDEMEDDFNCTSVYDDEAAAIKELEEDLF